MRKIRIVLIFAEGTKFQKNIIKCMTFNLQEFWDRLAFLGPGFFALNGHNTNSYIP